MDSIMPLVKQGHLVGEGIGPCNTCRFWKPDPYPSEGECRRHAPIADPAGRRGSFDNPLEGRWPMTGKDDGCGDHRPFEKENSK